MLIVGLTGGIGSGKSTVAALFETLNVPVIDTDQLARQVVSDGQPAVSRIISRFGNSILDDNGEINRSRLRALVFQNSADRIWLEQLLHPLIRQEILTRLKELSSPYCLIIIPLLFETTPNPLLQHIVVVDTSEIHQYRRALRRDQLPLAQLKKIMARQVSRQHRLAGADDVIYNDRDIDYLTKQVIKLHEKFLRMANFAKTTHLLSQKKTGLLPSP